MMPGKRNQRLFAPFFVTLLCCMFVYVANSCAALKDEDVKPDAPENTLGINLDSNKDSFEYKIANRPDPFVPFYTGEAVKKDPNEIIDSNEQLVGMQLFEPGQLTLVGMMKVHDTYEAMVQDSKGQGYILREGMKIGRRGQIKQIVANKVLIEETATTRSGKTIRDEVVMTLRKEGER